MTPNETAAVVAASAAIVSQHDGITWAGSRTLTLHAIIDTMLVELAKLPSNPPLSQTLLAQALELAVANSNGQLTWDRQPKFNHLTAHVNKGWVEKVSPGLYRLSAVGRVTAGFGTPQPRVQVQPQPLNNADKVLNDHGVTTRDPETDSILAEEINEPDGLVEGAVRAIFVNAYERNPQARRQCIEVHGTSCCVCRFNFAAAYGRIADGYIHIHHLRPLSEVRREYVVDPIEDLRPVCPNCHAVLHLGGQCRTIEEVRELVANNRR